MTVPAQTTTRTEAVGNGVTTIFAFEFLCLESRDLQVSIDGAVVPQSQYTVTGLGQHQGGTIIFLAAPANGAQILMELAVVPDRQNDYQDFGDLFAGTVNFDFDRIWLAIQSAVGNLRRALQLGLYDADGSGAYRANNNRIQDLGDPIASRDAVHRQWVDARISEAAIDGAGEFVVERLADTEDPDNGAGMVGFIQSGAGAVARTTLGKMRERVSPYDFGAKGDGIADDTIPLQLALDTVGQYGGQLDLLRGRYRITDMLLLSGFAQPATIVGAGTYSTQFVRGADWDGPMLRVENCTGLTLAQFGVICDYATYPSGTHGIGFSWCQDIEAIDLYVHGYKDSGIIFFTPLVGDRSRNCHLIRCVTDGLGVANNGILISSAIDSGMRDCYAWNVSKSGEPAYGLQLKNDTDRCYIIGGGSTGARAAVGLGQDTGTPSVKNTIISDVNSYDCTYGLRAGRAEDITVDSLNIDMNNTGAQAIGLDFCKRAAIRNVSVQNLQMANRIVNLNDCEDVNVEISSFHNTNNTATPIRFNENCVRNHVMLTSMTGSQPTMTQSLVTDLSPPGSNNIFEYGVMPASQLAFISAGAVQLAHSKITRLRVGTEGGAALDDLDTITGGMNGQTIILSSRVNAEDVVVRHNTGNIVLNNQTDITLDYASDMLTLTYDAMNGVWAQVAFSNNR